MFSIKNAVLATASAFTFLACEGGQLSSEAPAETTEDAVVTGVAQPLCNYTGMAANVTGTKDGAWQESYTSANGDYSSCGWVVELSNTQSVTEAGGGWNDLLLDGPNACSKAKISVKAYGFKNGSWQLLGSRNRAGAFSPATTGNQFNTPADCSLSEGFNFASGYSKIRVIVKGTLPLGGNLPQANVAAFVGELEPPH